jgi:hypothetical protein
MRRKLTGILAFGGIGIAVAASASLGLGAFAAESASNADAATRPTASATAEIQADAHAEASPSAAASPSPTVASETSDPIAADSAKPVPADPAAATPAGTAPVLTERQQWLVFQDAVRQCMAGAGKEYLYFEWWNPIYQGDGDPARPQDLSPDEAASWSLALYGDTGGGADYHWEDAGCWGVTVQQFGNTH